MPVRQMRPRRPIAWNALLRKGHAHTDSRTVERRAARVDLDSALDEFRELEEERRQRAKDDPAGEC